MREFVLGLLLDQRLSSKVSASPPDGARYTQKTGELEGVEDDAGSYLLPGRSFALVVLVEGEVGLAMLPASEALRTLCGFYAGAEEARS